jgi:hypothetical protein
LESRPYVVEVRAGRLLEARVFGLRGRDEVDAYAREIAVQIMRLPSTVRPVLCADHRPVAIYPQPAADRLTELFVQMNERLERVAILVAPTNATLNMQLARLVREAAMPHRRVFQDARQAEAHLATVLAPSELARMREFLSEFRPGDVIPLSTRLR